MEEIYKRLNEVFRDVFDDDSIEVNEDTTAADIEDWDSLEQINLLYNMEQRFGVKFSVDEVEGLQNVGETVDLIERKLS